MDFHKTELKFFVLCAVMVRRFGSIKIICISNLLMPKITKNYRKILKLSSLIRDFKILQELTPIIFVFATLDHNYA